MNQINKFYLTEFLKTQRYFLPVMILFLQFNYLSFTQIFILEAVMRGIVFILEIPSGMFADRFGKKLSLIISRGILIPALVLFAISNIFPQGIIFWIFLGAQTLRGISKAFKSGTHKAYIYEYMEQKNKKKSITEIFGKSKYWARIGEAVASLMGGFIAARLGFNAVFWFTCLPASLNFINSMTYEKIKEKGIEKASNFFIEFRELKKTLKKIFTNPIIYRLIFNTAIFVFCMEAAEKFFQPYMKSVGLPLELFGIIYFIILIITAIGSRYVYIFEKRFKRYQIINYLGFVGIIPFFILGFKYISIIGIGLFFIIIFLKTVRRPPMITELNKNIHSKKRATILSIEAFFTALVGVVFFPLIGYLADLYSMYFSIIVLGIILILNQIFFRIPKNE